MFLLSPEIPMDSSIVLCVSEHQLSMSFPLDSDGFLRRVCPSCEREFKWLPTPEGEEPNFELRSGARPEHRSHPQALGATDSKE
jgi:hypothetical protein